MDKQTNIDPDVFARVMALPTSLRHDVLKFLGASCLQVQTAVPPVRPDDTSAHDQRHHTKNG